MSEIINLYLDDLRNCPKRFILAKTVEQVIYYFKNFQINILSLDHDLGIDDLGNLFPTGYDLIKLIC